MKKTSVIFLGSKPGSVAALMILIECGWDVKYVVVSPQHDCNWIPEPSLCDQAKLLKIKVVSSQDDIPEEVKVDFVISYMYRQRVKLQILNRAQKAALNFHAGPLPEFAGWAFYNIAILEGSNEYGCTCHYMDENFDTGPLLKVSKFSINPEQETAFSLEKKAQKYMIKLFVDFCVLVESGKKLPLTYQDPDKMRYMKQNEFEKLKEVPLHADIDEIDKRARAFWYPPYTCAYMMINGKKIEIVPEIAKKQMAMIMHSNDLKDLLDASGLVFDISEY